MNSILSIFLCLAIVTIAECMTPEQKEHVMAIHKECSAQTGVTDETAEKVMQGEFPDDPKFKEHSFCFAKKIGFVNDAGEPQADTIKEVLKMGGVPEGHINEILAKCLDKKGSPEETTWAMGKCMHGIKHP